MQRILIIFLISLLFSCTVNQPNIIRNDAGLTIITEKGVVKLRVWTDNIIQVIHALDDTQARESLMVLKDSKQPIDWEFEQADELVSIITKEITLSYNTTTGNISFSSAAFISRWVTISQWHTISP